MRDAVTGQDRARRLIALLASGLTTAGWRTAAEAYGRAAVFVRRAGLRDHR